MCTVCFMFADKSIVKKKKKFLINISTSEPLNAFALYKSKSNIIIVANWRPRLTFDQQLFYTQNAFASSIKSEYTKNTSFLNYIQY